ncbi:unnamed protein product [Ambrosiozyma monospora]|uniref:Unnamed protein product n=1 Tax=Ambrosiozyma monospora TaxID=43982 RepID=A0ACB5U9B2_AMBMO|nr:unnamed protein product [Ambrosiozyma monospora]
MISVFQIVIMFVGGASFSVVRQTGAMWATAILCGVLAFPLGLIIRIVPDVWVERVFPTRLFNMLLKFMRFEPVVKNLKTLFKRAKRDPRSKKGKGKSSDDVESVGAVQVGSSGDIPMVPIPVSKEKKSSMKADRLQVETRSTYSNSAITGSSNYSVGDYSRSQASV